MKKRAGIARPYKYDLSSGQDHYTAGRCKAGFAGNRDTGLPQLPYPRLRQCANKKTAARQENGSGFFVVLLLCFAD